MTTGPDQLAAQLVLALLLLVLAGLLLGRLLRAIPGAGGVTLPLPGRGLLRRAILLLLLLVGVGLLLDALTVDGDRERLPVFIVNAKRTRRSPPTSAPPRPPASRHPAPRGAHPTGSASGGLPRLARPGQLRRIPLRLHL